jgi:hypothetical protein
MPLASCGSIVREMARELGSRETNFHHCEGLGQGRWIRGYLLQIHGGDIGDLRACGKGKSSPILLSCNVFFYKDPEA